MPKHAGGRTGDGHAHAAIGLRHKHPHQREARCRLLELEVSRTLGDGEADRGDDLTLLQRRGVHADKEVVGLDLALVGDDRGSEAQHRTGVAGSRVIVGHRATQRATRAHLAVADVGRQVGQPRDRGFHIGAGGDIGMARHGPDDQRVAFTANTRQFGDTVQVDDLFGIGQAQAHGGQQALPTGQQLAALGDQLRGRGGRGRGLKGECVHGADLLKLWRFEWLPTRGAAMQACQSPSRPADAARPARR
mmetsp:Transcript_14936/g.26291  ORF Transcript_14936/g.26291 Transcript_14936/m.26291 type:complete len:248 (+) Transcript_14936:640-1383(+)